MNLRMFLVALIFIAGSSIYGQVAPAATETHPPLTFGLGYSSYHTDWNGYLSGPMFWADWRFRQSSKHLGGIGVEMEARDLNYQRTGVVSNLRMDAAGGGPIYTWRHFRRIQPYGKFLVEFGSIDFTIQGIPDYTHDTRVVRVPGGGMNYHVSGNLWMRGDYEYQVWPHLGHGHALTPYGFTFGFSYDFSSSFAR